MACGQAGDREAYRVLLDAAHAWLRRYFACRVALSQLDDLVQDTLLSVHRKRASYDPARPFLPWLAAIARYRWVDHLRRAYRDQADELFDDACLIDEEPAIAARISLDRLITHLPSGQAEAIELVKVAGHSVEEASQMTGQSVSLVKVNIHRGSEAPRDDHRGKLVMSTSPPNRVMDELVADLRPVRPVSRRRGLLLAISTALLAVVASLVLLGPRADLASGHVTPTFLTPSGLFLLLGCAASWTSVEMIRRQVGNRHTGWQWACAAAALLPLAGLFALAVDADLLSRTAYFVDGFECVASGLGLGAFTAVALTMLLRRGAPTDPATAGKLVGIAAGCAGTLAVALHCPNDDIAHVGIWHGATVALAAAAGRFAIAPLLRW